MTAPPVDWSQLLALRELQQPGDADFVVELIQAFLADLPGRLARLHSAANDGDARRVALEAHTLKGSAAILWAEDVRREAELVEHQVVQRGTAAVADSIERLVASTVVLTQALHSGLATNFAFAHVPAPHA